MTEQTDAQMRRIYDRWHETIVSRDLDGLMRLYAEDAILESPLVLVTLADRKQGILRGKTEIGSFFDAGLRKLGSELNRWYRAGLFFSNGRQLIWEYPRETPQGDQVDLVEVMDIANGLIVHHRVYWGWVGVKSLAATFDDAAPSRGGVRQLR